MEVNVFFLFSFEMWNEDGKGVNFFLNFFNIVEWLRRGRGFFFFTNSLWGEGLVESSHF